MAEKIPPAFYRLRLRADARLVEVDANSPVESKGDALLAITEALWAMGELNLNAAIDYWHEVARRLGVPYSIVDREIRRGESRGVEVGKA
jgi:hypothetical protein